jgi:aconitase B
MEIDLSGINEPLLASNDPYIIKLMSEVSGKKIDEASA